MCDERKVLFGLRKAIVRNCRSSPDSHQQGGDKYVNLIGVEDVDNIHNWSIPRGNLANRIFF